MKISKALPGIIVPALALAGACVTAVPVHQAMPPATQGKITSTEVVVPIQQNEIVIFVPASQVAAAGGGGLLLALIDAGVNSANTGNAEAAVKPLRDSLVDFNFDETLQAELKNALSQTPGLNADGYRVVKEVTTPNFDSILDASKASAVLFVTANYQLTSASDAVTVSVSPFVFPKSPELTTLVPGKPSASGPKTATDKSLYRNVISFRDRVSGAKAERAANIGLWSANNGEAMRASLRKGAAKVAQLLSADMQAAPGSEIDPKKSTLPTMTVDGLVGHVVASDDEGSLVRFATGTQMYLTKAAQADLPGPDPALKKKSARERAKEQKERDKAKRAAAKSS